MAKKTKDALQYAIWTQRYNLAPLTIKYLTKKIAKGLDPRILLATQEYYLSIIVVRLEDPVKGVMYYVGVKPGKHSQSDITYDQLARMLEFGTSRMPARPHWRPTWSVIKVNSKNYGKKISRALMRRLREDYDL